MDLRYEIELLHSRIQAQDEFIRSLPSAISWLIERVCFHNLQEDCPRRKRVEQAIVEYLEHHEKLHSQSVV